MEKKSFSLFFGFKQKTKDTTHVKGLDPAVGTVVDRLAEDAAVVFSFVVF